MHSIDLALVDDAVLKLIELLIQLGHCGWT